MRPFKKCLFMHVGVGTIYSPINQPRCTRCKYNQPFYDSSKDIKKTYANEEPLAKLDYDARSPPTIIISTIKVKVVPAFVWLRRIRLRTFETFVNEAFITLLPTVAFFRVKQRHFWGEIVEVHMDVKLITLKTFQFCSDDLHRIINFI